MKKLLLVFSVLVLFGCEKDIIDPINEMNIPKELQIADVVGLKVESIFVSEEVNINAKLPYSGTYRIKIRDIGNTLVSQEKITAKEGDNILKVYVSTLANDSYILQLTDDTHNILGVTNIIVNN
jgi:hypothetical protein